MKIIPAIDIIEGKCVRLSQGDYTQKKIYHENPLDAARSFEDAGLKYLHLVDLDGAKAGKVTNWEVIESIASKTALHIDVGGGIKTEEEVKRLFAIGVKQINLGSLAVKDPAKVLEWAEKFGASRIIISADVKDGVVAINGWQDNAQMDIQQLIRTYLPRGIRHITCTDIHTDGTLGGPNIGLYKTLLEEFPDIALTASGGVSSIQDIEALRLTGVDGVIIGKALYEGKILLSELAAHVE